MAHNRWMVMLIGLGMLGACSEKDDRKMQAQNDNSGDISVSIGSGNEAASTDGGSAVSLDLPGIKGSFSLPKLKLHGDNIDIDGVKLAPGSTVTGIDVAGNEGTSDGAVTIRFETPQSPGDVQAYFLDAFKAKGLEASADGSGLTGRGRDGEPFAIDLAKNGSGTRGTIKMGAQKG